MRPHPVPSPADGESDLFRNRLDSLIDMRHEFVRLSGLIDWKRFDEAFGELYAEKGRPGLPTRLMVGLHLIKHARGLSDEQVCAQWLENAYFQYFSGETYFQTALPLDRTSMSVWRGRIGPEKLEALIAETLAAARRAGAVEPSQMRRVGQSEITGMHGGVARASTAIRVRPNSKAYPVDSGPARCSV